MSTNGIRYQDRSAFIERHPFLTHGVKAILAFVAVALIAGFFTLRDTTRDNEAAVKKLPALEKRLKHAETVETQWEIDRGWIMRALNDLKAAHGLQPQAIPSEPPKPPLK